MDKDNLTASASNMKNDVDKASSSNIEEDKASAPVKGKCIDIGSASDIDKDINKASASNMEKDDYVINVSNEGMETATKLMERLQNKMKLLTSQQDWAKCCIYRVPNALRNMKPEAYTPQLISIGPLHHGDKRLKDMEEHKLRFFEEFKVRNGLNETKIMDLLTSIQEKEKSIRSCYSESLKEMTSCDFVVMIVLDAVFIIEFFKKLTPEFTDFLTDARPRINFEPRTIFCILQDLMLLENQLPLFVIDHIFENFKLAGQDKEYIHKFFTFQDLAILQFSKCTFTQELEHERWIKRVHFIDLLRKSMLNEPLKRFPCFKSIQLKYSAVMLRKAGVKFQASVGNCLVNIQFKNGVLTIPRLEVDDSFERLVRNLMAWEQCYKPHKAYICNYFKFMDHLINTAEDVDLLVEEGIIINCLGDNAAVSNLINNLCQQIYETYSCYDDICRRMNAHYEECWNHRKATLKLVYFSNLWRGTGTVAAAILLILTLIQTITSIKSSFKD